MTEHLRITHNCRAFLRDAVGGVALGAMLTPEQVRSFADNVSPARSGQTASVLERLAAVGRLWGAIKFFHPYLAYKDIDWDGALVNAIPAIKAARTPDEYQQAVSRMLQVLNDPATAVIAPALESSASSTTVAKDPIYFRIIDEYVLINATALAMAMETREKEKTAAAYPQMLAARGKAKGIILDCRYSGVVTPEGYLNQFLQEFLPLLVHGNILLGTERYRIHNGYAAQQGDFGYSSASVTQESGLLAGKADSKKPLAIILDEKTPNLVSLFSGLQAAGAKIIQIGRSNEMPCTRTHQMTLPHGVNVQIRTTEFVHPNGSLVFRADVLLPSQSASEDMIITAAVTSLKQSASEGTIAASPAPIMRTIPDNSYPQMSFPSEEYRILALFRFWNVIHYFFPYKHLMDKSWDTALTDFIPRFLENKTQLEYEMTVAEMVARLQDSHGFVRLKSLDAYLGEFALPLSLRKNFPVTQIRVPFKAATDFDKADLAFGKYAYSFEQELPPAKGAIYKGRVVMLINEQAFSQAEHTCLFFAAATDATFIGSPTVGVNGGITNLVLPGGNYVTFTGGDVRHANGRQLQRTGIQPHIQVEPTPQGIREGRDEVLKAGIKYLDSTLKK